MNLVTNSKYICYTSPTECAMMNQTTEEWLSEYNK